MKVIFCDVDGVLNNDETTAISPNGYRGVSNELIRNLRNIVRETGAKIVLSSDWRLVRDDPEHSKDYRYLVRKLRFAGGLTIDGHTDDISWSKRGTEIKKYLQDHPEVTDYVILDDLPFRDFLFCRELRHLVLTDSRTGLTEEDVKRAVKILQGKKVEAYDKDVFLAD